MISIIISIRTLSIGMPLRIFNRLTRKLKISRKKTSHTSVFKKKNSIKQIYVLIIFLFVQKVGTRVFNALTKLRE